MKGSRKKSPPVGVRRSPLDPASLALVRLVEGPQLLAGMADAADTLRGDAPVQLQVAWEGDLALPRFTLRAP